MRTEPKAICEKCEHHYMERPPTFDYAEAKHLCRKGRSFDWNPITGKKQEIVAHCCIRNGYGNCEDFKVRIEPTLWDRIFSLFHKK